MGNTYNLHRNMRLPRLYNCLNRQLGDSVKRVWPYLVDSTKNQKQKVKLNNMEATNYKNIGPVLQLNKAGELTQKRMKAAKVCDGLYVTEPDKRDFVRYIIECEGVMWVEDVQHKSYAPKYATAMPKALERVKSGFYGDERFNDYRHEINRRINHPEAPAIMELKKPERKKTEPLPEGAKKVSVYMCKGCTAETTDKKVVITEIAPHVYTYVYKLKKYGERVKIIFEIDGVYFQGHDTGAYVLEREDFTGVCTKAYELARQNIADGAASGMAYFIELQKRINAAQPTETPQISAGTAERVNVSAEGEKTAETHENKPERKIKYFHYTPEQLKRYIIDVYEKNAKDEWRLLPHEQMDTDKCFCDVIDGKIGEWDSRRKKFIELNMDFNSPTCWRCFKINRTYQKDNFIVSDEKLLEFTVNGNYYYIQRQTYSKGKHKWCYTIMDAYGDFAVDDFSYTKKGIIQRFNKWWKKYATIIWQASEAPTEPPQSPGTPQATECTTDTPKPRETARKEQKRVIRSFRTAQPRTIKRFLIVHSVPRFAKCSTAHHIAGVSKMVYSAIIPPSYAPPIRGNCKLSIPTRAKPPNVARSDRISNYKPP